MSGDGEEAGAREEKTGLTFLSIRSIMGQVRQDLFDIHWILCSQVLIPGHVIIPSCIIVPGCITHVDVGWGCVGWGWGKWVSN